MDIARSQDAEVRHRPVGRDCNSPCEEYGGSSPFWGGDAEVRQPERGMVSGRGVGLSEHTVHVGVRRLGQEHCEIILDSLASDPS